MNMFQFTILFVTGLAALVMFGSSMRKGHTHAAVAYIMWTLFCGIVITLWLFGVNALA